MELLAQNQSTARRRCAAGQGAAGVIAAKMVARPGQPWLLKGFCGHKKHRKSGRYFGRGWALYAG